MVTIFRELRDGVTDDGKTKVKTPSGSMSTAEAISVVSNGMAMAGYFGDGAMRAGDLISGLIGAVVKDPVQDQLVWQEYLQTVVKERDAWKDLYRASKDLTGRNVHPRLSAFAIMVPAVPAASARRWTSLRPDVVVVEGPTDAEEALPLAAHEEMQPPVAMLIYPTEEPRRAVYYPLTVFSPEWQTFRWALERKVPLRLMDLPQTQQIAMAHGRGEEGGRQSRPKKAEKRPCNPRPPARGQGGAAAGVKHVSPSPLTLSGGPASRSRRGGPVANRSLGGAGRGGRLPRSRVVVGRTDRTPRERRGDLRGDPGSHAGGPRGTARDAAARPAARGPHAADAARDRQGRFRPRGGRLRGVARPGAGRRGPGRQAARLQPPRTTRPG